VIAAVVDPGAALVVLDREFSNVNRIAQRLATCEAIATHFFWENNISREDSCA
jgi:hypothetical protein